MAFTKLLAGRSLPPERTFRYELPFVRLGPGKPAILLRHAGPENPALNDAWGGRMIVRGPSKTTREKLQREIDAPIIGALAIAGWESMYDDDLKPADFTPGAATELMQLIAERDPVIFDDIAGVMCAPGFFRDALPDAEAVGKG